MKCAAAFLVLVSADMARALTPLADEVLSKVAGQDGVSIVMDGATWSTQSLDYRQDGETLSIKGLSGRPVAGASGLSLLTVDAMPDHAAVAFSLAQTEFRVDDIVLGSGIKGYGGLRWFTEGNVKLQLRASGEGADSGLSMTGSALFSNGTAYVRHDGFDLIAKGVKIGANFTNATLSLPTTADGGNGLKLAFNNAAISAGVSGIALDLVRGDPVPGEMATPLSPDNRFPNSARSFGSFAVDVNASGSLMVTGGGALNEGLRIQPDLTWSGGTLEYKGTGLLRASAFSGALNSKSGVTFDLETDPLGSYVKLATADLNVATQLGSLVVGDPANRKLGGVGVSLSFQDSVDWKNWLKLRPGGDVNGGQQGLTAEVGWNLADGSASITDNNNSLWLSGLKSHGAGSLTLDLTRGCGGRGLPVDCYAGTNSDMSKGEYNGHFDGLRLGFSNVIGSYSFDGIRVGSATARLQGGTELLLLAGVFPAYDFKLNGQVTLIPGGLKGDGFGFNADLFLTNSNAGVSVDEFGKGVWLTDMSNEMHYRNGSVEVSNLGLVLNKGEYWSKLNAGDLRLGSKTNGKSLGRLMIKTYEEGSSLTVATGGAGALCVGANGNNPTQCAKAGGRWEDRGDEGLSVKLKTILVRDKVAGDKNAKGVVTDDKRNQVLLEVRRSVNPNGDPVNGSGVQVVLDNFWTSDARIDDPNANTFGVVADLDVDVAPTIVKSKTPPYTKTTPLGFAVSGRLAFKEIGVDRLQNVHPIQGAQTVLYGMRIQNADVRFNLTATPIN